MMGMDAEVEGLRVAVSRYFPVAKVLVNPFAVTFHVTPDPASLDETFDRLRRELVPKNYIPSIVRENGGYVVHVQKRPEPRFRGVHVNFLLLLATIGTTSVAGAANWQQSANVPFPSPESIAYGFVSFTIPLLAILGAHEMGHYVMAKRHGVRASLPFFIPSIPPLGTFGAFISMRDPIPNRKALLEIGLAGPLIGFILAIPITVIGLFLTAADPRPPSVGGGGDIFSPSILYGWMLNLFPNAMSDPFRRHPTAFAGWVGLFVTAINLLPAGQLDGGHVARALLGNRQVYVSWAAVLILFGLSITFSYPGWFLFGFLIFVLGIRHPPPLNDITRLDVTRKLVGIGAVAILVLTFVPQPFAPIVSQRTLSFEVPAVAETPITQLTVNVSLGTPATIPLVLNHSAPAPDTIVVTIDDSNLLSVGFTL